MPRLLSRMAGARRADWSVAFAAVCLVVCRGLAIRTFALYDDAFITYRNARNLAMGHGFVYHVGERVLATTTPLFGLLCTLPFAMHLPMPATARAFNVACDLVTLLVTWRLLRDFAPPAARWLFAAFFAFGPILNRIAAGGMEMNLYVMLSVLAVHLDQRGRRGGVALAALGYFLRPESLLLVALLLVRTWRRGGVRAALFSSVLAAAIVGLPLIGFQAYYGALLSQSVMAKWHMVRAPMGQVVKMLLAYDGFLLALLPLTGWGLWRALRQPGPLRILALWMLLQVAAYATVRPVMWSWYVEPMVYVAVALAGFGGGDLLARRVGGWRNVGSLRRAEFAAPALAALAWIVVALRLGPSPVTGNLYQPLATWCRTHGGPGVSIMAMDIGAVGYYSDSRVYDQVGLVWAKGESMGTADILRQYAPDYVFVDANRDGLRLMTTPEFRGHYRPVARFAKSRRTDLVPDPAHAPAEWIPDYFMCARVDPAPAR